ncbi:hypothetical protein KEM52_003389 [Ascosphaera acerosa]|nr:hypothetical protein KEM52_003389 [Ascosphaera acerosa]
MAQGALKKAKPKAPPKKFVAPVPSRPRPLTKGAKVFAPKKARLVKQQKVTKKLTSGLTAKTERMLAERAGHLELLAGGKKEKQEKAQEKAKQKR